MGKEPARLQVYYMQTIVLTEVVCNAIILIVSSTT